MNDKTESKISTDLTVAELAQLKNDTLQGIVDDITARVENLKERSGGMVPTALNINAGITQQPGNNGETVEVFNFNQVSLILSV